MGKEHVKQNVAKVSEDGKFKGILFWSMIECQKKIKEWTVQCRMWSFVGSVETCRALQSKVKNQSMQRNSVLVLMAVREILEMVIRRRCQKRRRAMESIYKSERNFTRASTGMNLVCKEVSWGKREWSMPKSGITWQRIPLMIA